jgi:hypothetical protein
VAALPDWAIYLPVGRLFTLGSLLTITEVAKNFGLLYFKGKRYKLIFDQRKDWAAFSAILSKTHLAALLEMLPIDIYVLTGVDAVVGLEMRRLEVSLVAVREVADERPLATS